jgi:MraZ protein
LHAPFFVDSFDLLVDDQNRLLIPSEFRRRIDRDRDGGSLYLTSGTINGKPWLYTKNYYEYRASLQPIELMPGMDQSEFDLVYYAMASELPIDKQGRILIAEKTLKRLGLGKELTMCGARDHLELWNRDDWEAFRAEADRRKPEITARQSTSSTARRQNPAPPL